MESEFCLASLKVRYHSEDLEVDGRIILRFILGRHDGSMWTWFIWLRIGSDILFVYKPTRK
jgi:hypothetical protein